MDKNYIVTKSNKLITANYELSLQEQKIILTLASMVQPQDVEFKEYEFKIVDFMKLLDIKTKTKYADIPKLTKELMKKVFEIKEGNDILQLSWLCSARYKTNEGKVILKFAPDLKPYMLRLKEFYTSYKLDNILSLKSKYSLRLYEILKSNEFKKCIEINLLELKKMVGAKGNSYNIYQNFKNRVLIVAQKELKEKTDIKFEFEEIKTGRKVTSIRFYIEKNKTIKKEHQLLEQTEQETAVTMIELSPGIIASDDEDPIKRILKSSRETTLEITDFEYAKKLFKGTGLSNLEIKKVYETAKKTIKEKKLNVSITQYLTERKQMVDSYAARNDLEHGYLATLLNCIKKWNKPKKVYTKQRDSFCDYEQRSYDFEELERKLLGWDKDETEKENEEETAVNFTKLTNEKKQDFAEEQLRKLSELRDLGILTSDEYELKKEMLLNGSYKPI